MNIQQIHDELRRRLSTLGIDILYVETEWQSLARRWDVDVILRYKSRIYDYRRSVGELFLFDELCEIMAKEICMRMFGEVPRPARQKPPMTRSLESVRTKAQEIYMFIQMRTNHDERMISLCSDRAIHEASLLYEVMQYIPMGWTVRVEPVGEWRRSIIAAAESKRLARERRIEGSRSGWDPEAD